MGGGGVTSGAGILGSRDERKGETGNLVRGVGEGDAPGKRPRETRDGAISSGG